MPQLPAAGWHAGLRSADDTYVFVHKLYLAVGGRPSINTDGYSPYKSAVPLTICHQVDYAQIVKHFQNGGDGHARRYFFEAKESEPVQARLALLTIGKLYDVERRAGEHDQARIVSIRGSVIAGSRCC